MARKQMVKPVTVDLEVAAEEKPRNQFGFICPCGSGDVVVEVTETIVSDARYPSFLNQKTRRVRRYFRCNKCRAMTPQISEITERVLS